MLKAVILSDNIADGEYAAEWGFCVFIEYGGKRFLLDTGSSDLYLENAAKAGISPESADFAVLSHAHYDHSGGYPSFFAHNENAALYISSSCAEDCYSRHGAIPKYIGIPHGVLDAYADRIKRVDGAYELSDGVWLIPHLSDRLERIGRKARLFRKTGGRLRPDDFSHEQSLVFDTEKGLVVFNSCSHAGLDCILSDVRHFLPGKHVYMTVGGLHLSHSSKRAVRRVARTIRGLGIDRVVTGHCTGGRAYEILRCELGETVVQTRAGMVITAE